MAYENKTYEDILNRMITQIKVQYPNVDTREGSIIFNALAPAALELSILYRELDNVLNESFVLTASREYLLRGCEQMGMDIYSFDASAGTHKGVFDVEVPIGSRWNCDLYNYIVNEYIEQDENGYYTYRLECETVGTAPNNTTGTLTPITDEPSDLTLAEITECLIEGENEKTDAEIRNAYYEYVMGVAVDGNIQQYKTWCANYDGIGNCKVFPLWNGANTVKVSILSSSNGVASDELIEDFQEYLDPGCEGMGNGVAPIGAYVTVSTASERYIEVSGTVKMKPGYTDTSVIDKALEDYFASISYEKSTVPYMTVGAVILGVEGVDSISDLSLDYDTYDIQLGEEEIPVLSYAEWTVV